jgi:hypothetical protein
MPVTATIIHSQGKANRTKRGDSPTMGSISEHVLQARMRLSASRNWKSTTTPEQDQEMMRGRRGWNGLTAANWQRLQAWTRRLEVANRTAERDHNRPGRTEDQKDERDADAITGRAIEGPHPEDLELNDVGHANDGAEPAGTHAQLHITTKAHNTRTAHKRRMISRDSGSSKMTSECSCVV